MSYHAGKLDLTPRRHHGYAVLLFIFGTLFPPMAVAARFGFGKDFWLNLLLTICGYIPGHVHNFYIQNVRNNKNHRRTPKWAQRYGLVDTSKIERDKKRSQWASRYNDRLPHSVFEGQEYAEGEIPDNRQDSSSVLGPDARSRKNRQQQQQQQERLWDEGEERYYGQRERDSMRRSNGSLDSSSISGGGGGSNSGGRWHYPANFEDTLPMEMTSMAAGAKKKKKSKKDRWARTEDAYNAPAPKKHRKSKKKNHSTVGGAGQDGPDFDRRSSATSLDDGSGFPEDPEGGLYGERRRMDGVGNGNGNGNAVPGIPDVTASGRQRDPLEHDF
ncbi:hypothetical protein ACEPAH_5087 [Sanghuangporus vaninii]